MLILCDTRILQTNPSFPQENIRHYHNNLQLKAPQFQIQCQIPLPIPSTRISIRLGSGGGFRASLQSVSRRLKELVVAAACGELPQWDMLVTGHSLGGALATLFVADIAEYGVDAGRGLPLWQMFGTIVGHRKFAWFL